MKQYKNRYYGGSQFKIYLNEYTKKISFKTKSRLLHFIFLLSNKSL